MAIFTAPRLFAAFALVAIALPAAAKAAGSAPDQSIVTISTSGLNLANPAAQATLAHRIVLAAHKVCGQVTAGDALSSDAFDDCVGRATADAKSQMQSRIAAASTRAMVASITAK
jgi:UrcA family protein